MTGSALTETEVKHRIEEVETGLITMFASLYAETIEAMRARFGPEALQVARQAFMDAMLEMSKEGFAGIQDRDLRSYVDWLTTDGTEEGHAYEVLEMTDASIRLKYTQCPWATAFRAVGHPEIGRFFCEADAPIAAAFSQDIQFERTKTLMGGDPFCDHHFFTEQG